MENYKKGRNVEEPLERDKIPIPNLPQNFLWMHVRGGSKIRNLLTHALNEFPEVKCVVWTGFGQSVGKAVTCVEIMKRQMGGTLHQITKIGYRLVEEYWDPLLPQLDTLVVKRKLPMIHVLLSSEPLDCEESGYQAPGVQLQYEPGKSAAEGNSRKSQVRQGKKQKENRKRKSGKGKEDS